MLFRSRFPGSCTVCRTPIQTGEMIDWSRETRKSAHARCTPEGRQAEVTKAASRATDAAGEFPAPAGQAYLPFQRAGIAWASSREASLIADEMGLGKTIQAIGAINATNARCVVIVCPKSLVLNWIDELKKWLVADILVGRAKDIGDADECVAVCTHHEAKLLECDDLDLLILDEAHAFKNFKAQRTQAVVKLAKSAKRRILLTGTPIENRPFELYTLLNILQPGQWGSAMKFGMRYANGYHDGYGWNFKGASNLDELQDRLRSSVMIRRLKADVLTELPAKRRQLIKLEAPTTVKKALAEENDWFERQVEYQFATTESTCERAGDYAGQVDELDYLSKVDFTEISATRHALALSKVPAVVEHVESLLESTDKLLLFAHHGDVITQLTTLLEGYDPVSLTGQNSPEERQEAVKRFQADPTCRVFIGSISAAGVGLTLTAASTVVFAEPDWRPSAMFQCEDRAHRIGQHSQVLIQYLAFDGSLDARMLQVLIKKQGIADNALDVERVPVQSEAPELTPKQKALVELASKMTPSLISEVHVALQRLAGVCDQALQLDGAGFNKLDAPMGHRLARAPKLSPKQAAMGFNIVKKYHRQVGKIAL